MAQGTSNTKLKLLYLMKIFLEKTDDEHSITMPEIISELKRYNISAERKSLYDDMECLRQFGLDIVGTQENRAYHYRVANRSFELAELKLLVDCVQSAKFITEKKSDELIKKIESLASSYEASQLNRQVYVTGRVKAENENIYYNIDAIYSAISANESISFQYFNWDRNKQRVPRRGGALYEVSPWALSYDDEYYYLIAYDSADDMVRHFRVDKMLHISGTGKKREGQEKLKSFDLAQYAKKTFGMFSGDEQTVTLRCKNELAGVVIDRFGRDIMIIPDGDDYFTVNVKVSVSLQFLGWVMSIGEGLTITGPEDVVRRMRKEAERLTRQYGA